MTLCCPWIKHTVPQDPKVGFKSTWIWEFDVIDSNSTRIGIEIIFNPRIGIVIEYFLEKVIGIGIGIDQNNWCISSISMEFQGYFFLK